MNTFISVGPFLLLLFAFIVVVITNQTVMRTNRMLLDQLKELREENMRLLRNLPERPI